MLVGQFDAEHGAREDGDDFAFGFNKFVWLHEEMRRWFGGHGGRAGDGKEVAGKKIAGGESQEPALTAEAGEKTKARLP
jgi:hypothetical protein